jgi:hypothetical protein
VWRSAASEGGHGLLRPRRPLPWVFVIEVPARRRRDLQLLADAKGKTPAGAGRPTRATGLTGGPPPGRHRIIGARVTCSGHATRSPVACGDSAPASVCTFEQNERQPVANAAVAPTHSELTHLAPPVNPHGGAFCSEASPLTRGPSSPRTEPRIRSTLWHKQRPVHASPRHSLAYIGD